MLGSYRYGFNGKENDNEVQGDGNQQDYGMRIYDPRLGRFLSEDPITAQYPELTPYQFASNRPIDGIDRDGLEYAPGGHKTGGEPRDNTSVTSYSNRPEILEDQIKDAPNRQKAQQHAELMQRIINLPEVTIYGTKQRSGLDKIEHENKRVRLLSEAGYNADGSPGFGKRLVQNKTWNNFANNLALPIVEAAAFEGAGKFVFKGFGMLAKPAGTSSAAEGVAASFGKGTGTVWDDIVATQGNYPGSVLPRSFELTTPNGTKVWVHGNATEHIAEYLKMKSVNFNPPAVRLTTQQQLRSMQAAVNAATTDGVKYNQLIHVADWELKFGSPKTDGQLPPLIHALIK